MTDTGQQTEPTIYLARELDGRVWSYDNKPEWHDSFQSWVGHLIGGYEGSESWPESKLPRGMMGLATLDLCDRPKPASVVDGASCACGGSPRATVNRAANLATT